MTTLKIESSGHDVYGGDESFRIVDENGFTVRGDLPSYKCAKELLPTLQARADDGYPEAV